MFWYELTLHFAGCVFVIIVALSFENSLKKILFEIYKRESKVMKRLFVGLMMTLFFAGNALQATEVVDKTLAVVNGEPILASEFNYIFSQELEEYKQYTPAANQTVQKENELRDSVLERQIVRVILKQEAKKQKVQVTKKEIQDNINKIKKEYANDSEFNAHFKKMNMTMSDLEKNISDGMIINKFIQQHKLEIKAPSEAEIKSFYDKIIIKMKGGKTNFSKEEDMVAEILIRTIDKASKEHVRLRQIFINCPKGASAAKAKQARDKIAVIKGELRKRAFEDIATQYSDDDVLKSRGGDMGSVVKEDIPSAMGKIAFSIDVGDYTKEPIKIDDGYCFLKVEEKRAKRNITFENVSGAINNSLCQIRLGQASKAYTDSLRSKATIKINKTW
jgi:parvulin-like peptidyl-prolyl isomerase